MNIRKPIVCSFICLAIILLAAAAAFADTIRLKDGSVLKGKVVSYNQRKFTIMVYIGGSTSRHEVSVDEIDSVEFDASDVAASNRAESISVNSSAPTTPAARAETPRQTPPTNYPTEAPVSRDTSRTVPAATQPEQPAGDADSGAIATIAEKTVSIAAAADWTSTEIRVQRGQRIVINASGEVDLGDNQRAGPDGLSLADTRKLIAARPTGALIAVVGDDNDDFVFIGKATEFVSPHNGILFLSVNEGNLKDNAGAFVARVKVLTNK
ncbi:MAG: hypothetical protein ACREBD_05635 [Blastocatellia bacterium]